MLAPPPLLRFALGAMLLSLYLEGKIGGIAEPSGSAGTWLSD